MKRIRDFTDEEREVIRERRKYQSAGELAAVFGCDSRTINAIVRDVRRLPPMSEADMRELYRDGETVAEIAAKARVRNGLPKEAVRIILFGEAA